MKLLFAVIPLISIGAVAAAGDAFKFRGGAADARGQYAAFQTKEVEWQGEDQIAGQCQTTSDDAMPIEIPCRNVELILQSARGTKVATANVDPRGGFIFAQIPKGHYTMVIRSSKPKLETKLEGLQPGFTYDVKLDPPTRKPTDLR